MNILRMVALIAMPLGMQAFTVHNRSLLPVIIKQIVIHIHNGHNPYQTIEQAHIIVKPKQSLSFGRADLAGLQFTFNNTIIALSILQTDNNSSITLEKNNTIIPSENVVITSQEPMTLTTKSSPIGPRLA